MLLHLDDLLLNERSVLLFGVSQTTVSACRSFWLVQVDVHLRVSLQSRALVTVTYGNVAVLQVHHRCLGNQVNGSIWLWLFGQIPLNESVWVLRDDVSSASLAGCPSLDSVGSLESTWVFE